MIYSYILDFALDFTINFLITNFIQKTLMSKGSNELIN